MPAAQDEVQRLAETLNGMLDRLEGASAAQRAFVADAAHELRSPLSAIRTQLEVARRHPDSAPWEETADGVLADTDRLARLVDDLLLLARSEDRVSVHRSEPVDLVELAREVSARPWAVPVTLESLTATTGSVSSTHAGNESAQIRADPDAVTRILVNLVDNAARYARTAVTIAVRRDGGLWSCR